MNDLACAVPRSVVVIFEQSTDGGLTTTVVDAITVTLASLGLQQFLGTAGFAGSKVLHSTSSGEALDSDERTALAQRLARDWYLFALGRAEARYEGVFAWDMEGHSDCVEFEYVPDRVSTRVLRGPYLDHLEDVLHTAGAGGILTEFDVQLTSKCYYDGSDTRDPTDDLTPTGDGLNCPPDVDCLKSRFVAYGWVRVTDGTAPCALTWTAGTDFGTPACWPVYHMQNIDLPVYPEPSPMTRRPQTAANASGSGSVAWSNADRVKSSNDRYATVSLEASQESQHLKVTNFCFNLPGDAVISSVTVGIEAKASGSSAIKDEEVKLVVGGSITGNNLATTTALSTTDNTQTIGTSPSSWGVATLSPLDVNDSGFGFAIRYKNYGSETYLASVDLMYITIAFSGGGAIGLHHSVVRVRKGAGNYYLMDTMPWVDLFYRTDTTDADGYVGYHRYWDPNAQEWRNGEEVRIQLVE